MRHSRPMRTAGIILRRERDKQNRARIYYDEFYTVNTVQDATDDVHLDSGWLIANGEGIPAPLVMVRENGSFIQPRIMQHVSRVIHGTFRNGSPAISRDWDFHSLRHTHATALVEAGVPLAVIQKRLGHAKIEMPEHYKDHVTETMEQALPVKLNAMYT